jgi:hypothetical protein
MLQIVHIAMSIYDLNISTDLISHLIPSSCAQDVIINTVNKGFENKTSTTQMSLIDTRFEAEDGLLVLKRILCNTHFNQHCD